jgi:superfamily II DNA or RNA helicase
MSKKLCEAFNLAGIPSVHLDGKTPKAERRELLQKFARGEFMVAWNVGLFGEGYDIAANSGTDVTIGCVIDCSPTQAVGMWLQRCGRGLRKQEKPAILLDHAGNAGRHGLPCQEREWSLTSTKRSKKDKIEPDVLAKQCDQCFCCHKPAPTCPECGYIYPVMERKIEEKEGELVEVTEEMHLKKLDRMQQGAADSVEKLMALGHSRKRAKHIVEARQVKESLQKELFKLTDNLTMAEIKRMKPKQLKQEIKNVKI